MARLAELRERAREALWLAPVSGIAFAMGLAVLTLNLDDSVDLGSALIVGFGGSADTARSILSTISASMLTFLGLVFTLTMVALQLATGFSPRVLRGFLIAGISKLALGTFVATFTYSVLVLREIVNAGPVPELSVTVAVVLVIVSLIIFVYFLSSIAQSLRVANIIERSGDRTRAEIDEMYSSDGEPGSEDQERRLGWEEIGVSEVRQELTWKGKPGAVKRIDLDGLRNLAERNDCVLEMRVQVGDFIPTGAPITRRFGGDTDIGESTLTGLVVTGVERTMRRDPGFGLRQLGDIAIRALSPGVNDPTTAVQALDQVHDILLRIGSSELHSGVLRGEGGVLRVLVPVHNWEDFVRLGCDEVRHYGEDSMQVTRRVRAMLVDLAKRLPECRREPVRTQLSLLEDSAKRSFSADYDQKWALAGSVSAAGSESGSDHEGRDSEE